MKKIFTTTLFVITALILIIYLKNMSKNRTIEKFKPMVIHQFIEKTKNNSNWKDAIATGSNGQIVLMSVSPHTNPLNEIGMEVHPFDQVILILKGKAKVILNKKSTLINEGDLIFIPKAVDHNVINLDNKNELKLISFYSENDMPKSTIYKTKAEESKE